MYKFFTKYASILTNFMIIVFPIMFAMNVIKLIDKQDPTIRYGKGLRNVKINTSFVEILFDNCSSVYVYKVTFCNTWQHCGMQRR